MLQIQRADKMKVDYEFSPSAKCVKPAKCQKIFCQRILSWLKMSDREEPWIGRKQKTETGAHVLVWLRYHTAPVVFMLPNDGDLDWTTVSKKLWPAFFWTISTLNSFNSTTQLVTICRSQWVNFGKTSHISQGLPQS